MLQITQTQKDTAMMKSNRADLYRPRIYHLHLRGLQRSTQKRLHWSNRTQAVGWIIDTPATIEHAGEKHIECVTCGTVISTAAIPKLPDNDNSDEDGNSKVGDYSILITDKDGKPVFDSEISIDRNDNITIKLPDGRLLSAEDITTITVTDSRTQQPATDINIFIADYANNAATGKTDANGQLAVPNTNSSTGNTNGTVADNDKTML